MEIKYTVEMDVRQEVLEKLGLNPAGLTLDDLVQTKIESALFTLCQKAILVYRAEEGKKPIDLFHTCPVCGHDWVLHFSQIENKQVSMSDGSIMARGVLVAPIPTNCSECTSQKQSCGEALKYK